MFEELFCNTTITSLTFAAISGFIGIRDWFAENPEIMVYLGFLAVFLTSQQVIAEKYQHYWHW
jgi:hypothetical protein